MAVSCLGTDEISQSGDNASYLALREAYEYGVILGGASAGSICWHQGGPTDSFGPELQTVTNALGFLPFGNAVHFDSEAQRRPLAHELIKNETFQTLYATDDGVGILYENEVPVEVIMDRPSSADGSAPYIIEKIDGAVRETRLNIGLPNRYSRQHLLQSFGKPPVGITQPLHKGRHEGRPYEGCIK